MSESPVSPAKERKASRAGTAKLLAAFQEMDSALGVGVNYEDCTRFVRKTLCALDAYRPKASDMFGQTIENRLQVVQWAYQTALDSWSQGIDMGFSVDEAGLQGIWAEATNHLAEVQRYFDTDGHYVFRDARVPTPSSSPSTYWHRDNPLPIFPSARCR